MTNYIKKLLALAVAVGAMTVLADAPEADVVWHKDFTVGTKTTNAGNYTLTIGAGNELAADGSLVTIGSTEPMKIVFPETMTEIPMTVILKYKNYTPSTAGGFKEFVSFTGTNANNATDDYTKDLMGVFGAPAGGWGPSWMGVIYSSSQIYNDKKFADYERMAVIRTEGGLAAYFDGARVNNENIKAGGFRVNQINLGGIFHHKASGTPVVMNTGLEIEGVAVFLTELTDEQIADYVFPETTPTKISTPVFLANMYNASAEPVAGWINNTQNDKSSQIPKTAEWGSDHITSDAGISFQATGGGNFFNTYGPVSTDFATNGDFVDIFGGTHATIAEEVATSLGLPEGTVFDASVYKTGIVNGGQAGHTATISNLDPEKSYAVYVGIGLNKDSQTQGFKIEKSGYGSVGALDYVVSENGGNTTAANQYQSFAAGTVINASASGVMIVRLVDITPKSDGTVVFTLAGERAGLNFLAVSEMHTAPIVRNETWEGETISATEPTKIFSRMTSIAELNRLVEYEGLSGTLGGAWLDVLPSIGAIVLDSEDAESVTYQLQVSHDGYLKVVWVKFTANESGIYAVQTKQGNYPNRGDELIGQRVGDEGMSPVTIDAYKVIRLTADYTVLPIKPTQTKFMKFYYPLDGDATNRGTSSDAGLLSTVGTPEFADGAPFGAKSLKSGNGNNTTGSYILADEAKGLVPSEKGWTLSFWFNSNGMSNWRDVCGFNIGSVNFKFEKTGANALAMYNSTTLPKVEGDDAIAFTAGEWMNLVVTFKDEEHFTVYANGVKKFDYPADSYTGELKIYGSGIHTLTKVVMGTKGLHEERGSAALTSDYAVYDYVVSDKELAYLATKKPKDFYAPKDRVFATLTSSAAWGDLAWTDQDGDEAEWVDGITATITVDADATLTLDPSVEAKSINFLGAAALTLTTADGTKPADTFLAKLRLGDYAGLISHSWNLKKRVIAINLNKNAKTAQGDTVDNESVLGDYEDAKVPGFDLQGVVWSQFGGANSAAPQALKIWNAQTLQEETTSATVTWTSANVYQWGGAQAKIIKGYLDDGGNQAHVNVADIPFAAYDVYIIAGTDTGVRGGVQNQFSPCSINGKLYKADENGEAIDAATDVDCWGRTQTPVPTLGQNMLVVRNMTGTNLSIVGGSNANNRQRGGIAAVILVETTVETYDTACNEVKSVSAANALGRDEPLVNIHLSSETVFSIDAEPSRRYTIVCDGDEKNRAIVLDLDETTYGATIPASFLTQLSFVNCDPVVRLYAEHEGFDDLPITKIYHYVKTPLATSVAGNVYMKGAGSAGAPETIAHNGGWAELRSASAGDVYYLNESCSGMASTVRLIDTTVNYSDIFGLGMATYELKGTTEVRAPRLILSDISAGYTANLLMQDMAKVYVTGTNNTITNDDTNKSTIMFGHWDGPSTFTIRDNAEFHAPDAQILVGRTRNSHTINLEGGVFETKGIKFSAQTLGAPGTNTLNLTGGTLKLGDSGISRYGETQDMTINLGGLTTIEVADGVTAPITFPIVTVDPAALDQAIIKTGAGTLDVGFSRPRMDVREGLVQITATDEEIEASELVLTVTPGASSASSSKIKVVSFSGEEIAVKGVAMGANNTVVVTLGSKKVTTSMRLSEMDPEILSGGGAIAVIGGEDCEHAIDITFDIPLPENVELAFSKHVNLKVAGDVETLPLSRLRLKSGACIALDAPVDAPLVVAADQTIKARATMDLTLTNNGTFVVTDGATATVTAAAGQAIKGTVTIEKGATFVNLVNDAVSYGESGTTVNVYGTLDMGTNRWTVGSQSVINLYGTAKILGEGDKDGALDIYRWGSTSTRDDGTIKVFNVDGEEPTAALIEGLVRTRRADGCVWIEEGATLAFTTGIKGAEVTAPKLTRLGEGHFAGTVPLMGPLTLDYGTQQKEIPAHFAVTSGDVTFHVTGKSGSDAAICVNDSAEDPFLSVAADATLKLKANNLSGSRGDLLSTGRIHVAGTLVMMDGEGNRYFRQPLVLEDGATMKINSGESPLILTGGAGTGELAQISLNEGTASIIVGETNGGTNGKIVVGTESDGDVAAAVFVGEEATLTITTPIETTKRLAKKGSGKLVVGEARPRLHVADGLVAIYATVTELTRGEIRLPYPTFAEGLTVNAVQAFDPAGGALDNLSSVKVDDELVITFNSGVITTSTRLSEVLGERTRGTIMIEGPADHADEITFTLDVALPAEMEVRVSGHVKFAVANGVTTIPQAQITRSATSCIGLGAPCDAAVTISANQTIYYYSGTNPSHSFTGAGRLVLAPAGTITVSQNNSDFTGPLILAGGTVKMGNFNTCLGQMTANRKVYIDIGATLDINGQCGGVNPAYCVVLRGGALSNSTPGAGVNATRINKTFPITRIDLEADSYIGGSASFGLVAQGYARTTVDLGGYTLTKTDGAYVDFCNTEFLNDGRIEIVSGNLVLNTHDTDKACQIDANKSIVVQVGPHGVFEIVGAPVINGSFSIGGTGEVRGFDNYPTAKILPIKTSTEGCLSFNSAINAQSIKLDVSEIPADAKVIPLLKVAAEDQLPSASKIEIPAAFSTWNLERMPGEEVYGYRLMRPNFVFMMVGRESESFAADSTVDPLVAGVESFEIAPTGRPTETTVATNLWQLASATCMRTAYADEEPKLAGAGDWYWHMRVESDTEALTRTFTDRDNWINGDPRVVKMGSVVAEAAMKFHALDFEPELPKTARLGLWLKDEGAGAPSLMATCGRVVEGDYETVSVPLDITIEPNTWHKVKIESYSDPDPSYAFGVFTITIDGTPVAAKEGSESLIAAEYVELLLANTRERELYAARRLFPSLAQYSSHEAAELVGLGFLGGSDIDLISVTAAADSREDIPLSIAYDDESRKGLVKVWVNDGDLAETYKIGTTITLTVAPLGNTEFAGTYADWTKLPNGTLTRTFETISEAVSVTIPTPTDRERAVTSLTIEVQTGTTLEALSINGVAVTPTTHPEGAKQGDVIRLTFAAVEGYVLDGDSEMTVPLAYGVEALAVTIKGPGAYREGNPPQTSVGPKMAETSFKLAIHMEGDEPIVTVEQMVTGGAQGRMALAAPRVVIQGSNDLKTWEPIADPSTYKNYHFFRGVIEE